MSRFRRRSGEGAAPGRAPHHWPGCRPSCPRTPLSMRSAAPTALLAAPSRAAGGGLFVGSGAGWELLLQGPQGRASRRSVWEDGRRVPGRSPKDAASGAPRQGQVGRRSPEGNAEGAISRRGQQRGDARPEAFRRPTIGRVRGRRVFNAEGGASCKHWAARWSPHYSGRRNPVREPQGPGGEGEPGSPSVLPCEGQCPGETRVLLR